MNASTGEETKGNPWQAFARIIVVFIPIIFIPVAFDKKKQGWHDKVANTVVVRIISSRKKESVSFNE